jgi:hypothetical protein
MSSVLACTVATPQTDLDYAFAEPETTRWPSEE